MVGIAIAAAVIGLVFGLLARPLLDTYFHFKLAEMYRDEPIASITYRDEPVE